MPPRNLSRSVALASAVAIGASTVLAGPTITSASPGGFGDVLSASNGSTTIRFESGATLAGPEAITDASWAPDGSRALYVAGNGRLKSIPHNGGGVLDLFRDIPSGVLPQIASPGYRGEGGGLVMAMRESANQPWALGFMPSTPEWLPSPGSPTDGRHYLNPDPGYHGEVVYQTQGNSNGTPTGTPSVGYYDPAAGTFTDIIVNASNPSISPNGDKVAFVRTVGEFRQIFVAGVDGSGEVQVTTNDAHHDNPVWSPEGTEIAANEGTTSVVTFQPDGTDRTVVPNITGVPAYRPEARDAVLRLSGANRVGTAVSISASYWESVGSGEPLQQADSVVLSRSDQFADALGGTTLAAAKKGPLLMTLPTALDPATAGEMRRILAPGKTVYLLGGTGALSSTVEAQVRSLGYTVVRLAGANRYETSIAIANAVDSTPDLVLAATGMNFPDALAAGAAAGSYNTPGSTYSVVLVLTNNTTLPAATRNYISSKYNYNDDDPNLFAVGGQADTALAPYFSRYVVSGSNRYETAREVAYTFFSAPYTAGIATGTNWPDALAGGALLATINAPLLLTVGAGSTLTATTRDYLSEHSGSVFAGFIFGGSGVVSTSQESGIGNAISGPGGFDVLADAAKADSRAFSTDAGPLAKRPAEGKEKPRPPLAPGQGVQPATGS